MARIFEKFSSDIRGILWAAASVFLGLSLASYHPTDPSFNSIGQGTRSVQNLCGYIGSFLSDLIYQTLGLSSWIVAAFMVRLAWLHFKGHKPDFKTWRLLWGGLLILVCSSLLGLYFPEAKMFSAQVHVSGLLGLALSKGLVTLFNRTGVSIILWSAAAVLVVFYTEKALVEHFSSLKAAVFYFWGKLRNWKSKKTAQSSSPNIVLPEQGPTRFALKPPSEEFLEEPTAAGLDFEEAKEEAPSIPIRISALKEKIKSKASQLRPKERKVENWDMPGIDLLKDPPSNRLRIDEKELARNARLVEQKLAEFDVTGQVVEVRPGPAVTMYEFKPAASVKINDITKLVDDLSLALSAESLRMIAPIPGRDVVGIETSNSKREPIYMKELVESAEFWNPEIKLPIALGKSVTGEAKIVDLRKMPHLLVAGTTGSGKSVFLSALLSSLILRHSPKTLKLIIVDPKQVDMGAFHNIPHLMLPVVKESKPAVNTLKWLIREMEKRYRSMSRFGARSLEAFNEAAQELKDEQRAEHEERNRVFEENPATKSQIYYWTPQPYIVSVIEEFADLMTVDKGGVEPAVVRLAQMARASGIHLVIAMQSPRREVLTGLIKTNFPGRISFKVAGKMDSQIILDQKGAERLLSVGDMLFLAPGMSQPHRYHGAYLTEDEIGAVTKFWSDQGQPQFEQSAVSTIESAEGAEGYLENGLDADKEEGYDEVVAFVAGQKEVSASLLQRRFRYGYPKASRLIEILEKEGVVGPANGSKPRSVLVNRLG